MDCKYKDICHDQCEQCEIAKEEKDIANFINAKNELIKPIKNCLTRFLELLQKLLQKIKRGIK